jgi:NADPH2 dehydrogenase
MAEKSALFTSIKLGKHQLQHKVALAPLTRMRGEEFEQTKAIASEYYSQRSSKGGLIITEGTHVSPQSGGQLTVPGIWNDEQAKYWKKVTDAIKSKGAIACCQLWHRGRCPGVKAGWKYEGKDYWPMGPSAIPEKEGRAVPTEMTIEDIETTRADFVNAAKVAIDKAGFDMIELHNANGYIGDQFLQSMSNKRTDEYGGSIEKRYTFTLKNLQAVTDAIGQEKVGIRFSPYSDFQGMKEKDPLKTFVPLVERVLEDFPNLAYIHLVEARIAGGGDSKNFTDEESLDPFRKVIEAHNQGTKSNVALIVAGVPVENALSHSKRYPNEILAIGRYFIANPDLPERLQKGWPLNKYDRKTFYTPGSEGYIDYPSFEEAQAKL